MAEFRLVRSKYFPGYWEFAVNCDRLPNAWIFSLKVCLSGWGREVIVRIPRKAGKAR